MMSMSPYEKERFLLKLWTAIWLVLFALVALVGWGVWNQIIYQDWTCGFKNCTVVKGEEKKGEEND